MLMELTLQKHNKKIANRGKFKSEISESNGTNKKL